MPIDLTKSILDLEDNKAHLECRKKSKTEIDRLKTLQVIYFVTGTWNLRDDGLTTQQKETCFLSIISV